MTDSSASNSRSERVSKMKKQRAILLTVIASFLGLVVLPSLALAQETTGTQAGTGSQAPSSASLIEAMRVDRIGLVDLDGVLRKSTGTQKVRQLLDEQRSEFQKEFSIRETALQETERTLLVDKEFISAEEFNRRLKAFEDEVAEVQRQIQNRRQALDRAFQEAQREIRALALEIVKEIAAERKLDLVMSQESALIFRPALNISDEVYRRLEKRTENATIEIKVGNSE